jgi:RNA polymerase sigma-70 factor (ECF subfamily)
LELSAQRPGVRPIPADARVQPGFDIAALTRRMVEGDDTAYRMFYDAYFGRLSRYLLVVTAGNEDATREALQATMRRVVKHIRVFTDEGVFWSWLTVLARSARSDEGRKRRRYLAFLDRFTRHVKVEPPAALVEERVDGRLGELLERHVAFLPADERELIEAKYFERRPVCEIAAQLQITEKAVESRLARIRAKLKSAVLAELKDETRA